MLLSQYRLCTDTVPIKQNYIWDMNNSFPLNNLQRRKKIQRSFTYLATWSPKLVDSLKPTFLWERKIYKSSRFMFVLLCSGAEITELNKLHFLSLSRFSVCSGFTNKCWPRYPSLSPSEVCGCTWPFVSRRLNMLIQNWLKDNSWFSMRLNS